jgi:integrase/recombinase XerD
MLVRGTMDIRARTVLTVLFKTGIRREEASAIDVDDIDWKRGSITLKPQAKRTNCVVYFDDETGRLLKRWLALRTVRGGTQRGPLFMNQRGTRLGTNGIYNLVTNAAQRWNLHDPEGPVRDRFTPHCCRHWFTTQLRRAAMPDYMIAELRGDADARTMDIYTHIDHDELREAYLAKIPQLNI